MFLQFLLPKQMALQQGEPLGVQEVKLYRACDLGVESLSRWSLLMVQKSGKNHQLDRL